MSSVELGEIFVQQLDEVADEVVDKIYGPTFKCSASALDSTLRRRLYSRIGDGVWRRAVERSFNECSCFSEYQIGNRKYGLANFLRPSKEKLKDLLRDRQLYWKGKALRKIGGANSGKLEHTVSPAPVLTPLVEQQRRATDASAGRAPSQSEPGMKAPAGRPHSGRPANCEFNQNVARVVKGFAPDWRKHLFDICETLDKGKLALPESPKWKSEGCKHWLDVFDKDPEGLVKALRHRVDWVSQRETPSAG